MVLLPAPAGPSMAIMSLRLGAVIVTCEREVKDCTREQSLLTCFWRRSRDMAPRDGSVSSNGGHGFRSRRRDLQQRAIAHVHKTQLTRGDERVKRLAHTGAGN